MKEIITKRGVRKRIILLITIMSTVFLLGCAKTGECDGCGQKEELKKYSSDSETMNLCDDCYRLEKIYDAF